MRVKLFLLLVFLNVLALPAFAQITILTPQHRLPEELAVVLQQQFPKASVSHFGNDIVVNASPYEISQMQKFLAYVDKPIKQLLLKVRMKERGYERQTAGQVQGTYCKDNVCVSNSGVSYPQISHKRKQNGHVNIQVNEQRINMRANSLQEVKALPGRSAYISIGQSVPVTTTQVYHGGYYGRPNVRQTQTYRDVLKGVYVVPRLVGDKVFLEVRMSNDSVSNQTYGNSQPVINTQQVITNLEGNLHQWLPLGQQNRNEQTQGSGFINAGSGVIQQLANYEIRVEYAD